MRVTAATIILALLYSIGGSAQNFEYARLSGIPVNTAGWTMTGVAHVGNTIIGDPNSEIILCDNPVSSTGAIYYNNPVDLSFCQKWTAEYDFRMFDGPGSLVGDPTGGADGIAFSLVDVTPGAFQRASGMGIPANGDGLKICFDNFNNCPASGAIPKIQIRWGLGYSGANGNDECSSMPSLNNDDGGLSFLRSSSYNHAKVVYDAGTISVYVNNILYLNTYHPLSLKGYFCFSSGTGSGFNWDNYSIKNVVIYAEMPPSEAGADVTICSGGEAQIGITPGAYTYSWTPFAGLNDAHIANPVFSATNSSYSPERHKLLVSTSSPSLPGCASTDSVFVIVLPGNILQKDTVLCEGEQFTLHSTEALSYSWSPSAGLSSTSAANPVVTVGAPGSFATYYLSTIGINNNLVVNGDFESGLAGYFTGYNYCNNNGCLVQASGNNYTIGIDANLYNNSFTGRDHTSGNGHFMIINGTNPGLVVWRQTIGVKPQTDYVFGTWISNLAALNPASIRLSVNGVQIGNAFAAPAATDQWLRYFTTWNSGTATSAVIEVVNVITPADGNHFGLDDIFFGELLACSDQVTLSVGERVVSEVNATICEGEDYAGHKSTGDYIDVYHPPGRCDSTRTLHLLVNKKATSSIEASICEGASFEGYSKSGTYSDRFVAANGCDSLRTLQLTVIPPIITTVDKTICEGSSLEGYSRAGTYTDLFRSALGCDSTRTLHLTIQPLPRPDLGIDTVLCDRDTLKISPGSFTTYRWQDGSVQPDYLVRQAGRYAVTVTDNCGTASDEINIQGNSCIVYFPTAFTPNRDGKNETFRILNAYNLENYHLAIYNRWGQKVFETRDITRGWDGRIGGSPAATDSYVWYCEFRRAGQAYNKKGLLTLIR